MNTRRVRRPQGPWRHGMCPSSTGFQCWTTAMAAGRNRSILTTRIPTRRLAAVMLKSSSQGQRHMFECIDLSLFSSLEEIPPLVRRRSAGLRRFVQLQSVKISFPAVCDPRSSLSQLDAAERQPSYSNLDEVVQASQAEEETARGAPVGLPAFEEPRHRVIWTSSSLDIYKVRIF